MPRWIWALLGVAIFLPHCFWGPTPGQPSSLNVGLPRIYSGDEPHYLVMIHSLIREGDLDLADNYQRVHRGGDEAGKRLAGNHLDPHISWATGRGIVSWKDVYVVSPAGWDRDVEDHPLPRVQEGKEQLAESLPDEAYSWHGWGLPVLLAPIAYPFRGTDLVEPVVVICSGLVVLGAMVFMHRLIQPFTSSPQHTFLVIAAAFLSTPVWAYGRTLFTEPYLLFCVTAAYALYLRRKSRFWPGLLTGVGLIIKPAIAVILLPLVLDCVYRRQWKQLALLVVPPAVFFSLVLVGNRLMYGSFLIFPNASVELRLWQHGIDYFFSLNQGLFFLSPVVAAALAGWLRLFHSHQRDTIIILVGVLSYFTLCPSFPYGNGSFCYGPRYLIPVIPLLFAAFPDVRNLDVSQTGNWTVILLLALSFEINLAGAVGCGNCWFRHPVELLFQKPA